MHRTFRPAARVFLAAVLLLALTLPASAFFWDREPAVLTVDDFSKNGLVGTAISFTAEDFAPRTGTRTTWPASPSRPSPTRGRAS